MSYKQAKEFSTVFGQAVHSEPSKELVILRSRLVNEEIIETLWASRAKDDLEIIDGIADIAYVVYGTLVALDKKDYSNLDNTGEYFYTKLSDKFSNDKDYEAINQLIDSYITSNDDSYSFSKYYIVSKALMVINEYFSNYMYSVVETGYNRYQYIFAIIDILKKLSQLFNVSLEEIVGIVHESNMSKLDSNGNPIYDKGGKVLKGENYFAPTEKLKELLDSRNK